MDQFQNQGQDQLVHTCKICKVNIDSRFHCTVCDGFDLCIKCHNTTGHVHNKLRLGFMLGDNSAGIHELHINSRELRGMSIQRCISSIEHASHCRDVECSLTNCRKLKKIVSHAKACKLTVDSTCAICEKLLALNCYHANNCQETKCLVPFCSQIKRELKQIEMERAQVLKCDQPMGSRSQSLMGANSTPNPSESAAVGIPQGMSNPGTSASSAMQQRSTAQVLQQLLTSLKSSNFQQQKQHILHLLKSNPQLIAAFIKQRSGQLQIQQQQQSQQAMIGQPLPQPQVWQQQQQLLPMQQRQQIQPNQFPETSASSAMQQRSNAEVLQQLLTSLKSSNFPQQKQQVLHLLKSNPQLMAAFIKQRSSQQQNQQQ